MLDDSLLDNLDCFSIDPQDLRNHARKLLGTDVSPRDRLTRDHLADYATIKAGAMECRLAGHITDALTLESKCERIYRGLPDYAKW